MSNNTPCEKCGGKTALVSGIWYYDQDAEPYESGIEEEAENSTGEISLLGFICDNCHHVQGIEEN